MQSNVGHIGVIETKGNTMNDQNEYNGYLIQNGLLGWYAGDWDWENTIWHGPFATKTKALDRIDNRNKG